MHGTYTLSDVGLRLIKSYEGFRPVDIELASGQRVVGYGHRVFGGRAMHMDKAKAEAVLRSDLSPYISMINDSVFAPLSQGQFDALVSLAFNIGPKRFLDSDVLRALNNGRVLDAANGFDVWRRAKINGESYVVDALVRRRTAEKILFLRPDGPLRAPRLELKAAADPQVAALSTHAGERIYEEDGHAQSVPYLQSATPNAAHDEGEDGYDEERGDEAHAEFFERRDPQSINPAGAALMRRREDHAGGILTLSEVYDDSYMADDWADDNAADYTNSPLVENTQDFSLDIDSENTDSDFSERLREGEGEGDDYIDDTLPAQDDGEFSSLADNVGDSAESLPAFDPDRDITVQDIASSEFDLEAKSPSAIAAAAAEVSGRLDALMAEAGDTPELETEAETDREMKHEDEDRSKVVPFPTRHEQTSVNNEPIDAFAYLNDSKSAKDFDVQAQDSDSAARFIEHGSSGQSVNYEGQSEGGASFAPLSLMVVLGMILGGASLGAILSGYAATFGMGGEFVATIGVLFGLMLFLGSVYYVFKNRKS